MKAHTTTEKPAGGDTGHDDFHKVVINAIPDPILVVDGDVCILDCNTAAAQVIGGEMRHVFGRRGGEVLHCIHAGETPSGCGRAPACRGCTIRNSVSAALDGQQPRRARHKLEAINDGTITDVHLLVTTAPMEYHGSRLVLLILEDISELVELRRILPICAHCHKVRDDAEYWQDVESFCRRKLDIQFSHGICPECMKRHYPDIVT
jgi:PAS domain-containing protein